MQLGSAERVPVVNGAPVQICDPLHGIRHSYPRFPRTDTTKRQTTPPQRVNPHGNEVEATRAERVFGRDS